MGARGKHSAERLRHLKRAEGTHVDKYAALAPTAPPPRAPKARKPPPSNERRVGLTREALDRESEDVLASLPGGTLAERLESARRGLFQNQDAIQSATKEDR